MGAERAMEILGRLAANPTSVQSSDVYELTEEYLDGYPLDTLRPFLSSKDDWVQRAVASILSELGTAAAPLAEDVIPLVDSSNPRTRFDALEVLLVCSEGAKAHLFSYVLRAICEQHGGLRLSVMELVWRALPEQIIAGASALLSRAEISDHLAGILKAMAEDKLGRDRVLALIQSTDEAEHLYGMIALARNEVRYAEDRERLFPTLDVDDQEFLRSVSRSR